MCRWRATKPRCRVEASALFRFSRHTGARVPIGMGSNRGEEIGDLTRTTSRSGLLLAALPNQQPSTKAQLASLAVTSAVFGAMADLSVG